MKYSLRSLMIGMTVLSVAMGYGAHAYPLIRLANEHEERSEHFDGLSGDCFLIDVSDELKASGKWHSEIASEYRKAVWRPWNIVDEAPPPGIYP